MRRHVNRRLVVRACTLGAGVATLLATLLGPLTHPLPAQAQAGFYTEILLRPVELRGERKKPRGPDAKLLQELFQKRAAIFTTAKGSVRVENESDFVLKVPTTEISDLQLEA